MCGSLSVFSRAAHHDQLCTGILCGLCFFGKAAHGTAVRKELAELLNLPPAQCTALLRRMADRGELLLTGKRYALPPQKKPLETN